VRASTSYTARAPLVVIVDLYATGCDQQQLEPDMRRATVFLSRPDLSATCCLYLH